MIKNESDLLFYLQKDKEALKVSGVKNYFFHDIWRFQRILRKHEYYANCNSLLKYWYAYKHKSIGRSLGITIPINTCGAGLSIAHIGTIVINGGARIGQNCRIHVCVNIGASAQDSNAVPVIGDNCYIGPGAKLYGAIVLGDNVAIGANSVVNKSFNGNCVIAGCPAKIISLAKLNRGDN